MKTNLRFKRHFHVIKKDDLQRYSRVLANSTLVQYKEIAEDYLRILRLRFPKNALAIINLQHHMLTDIAIAERTIRDYKRSVREQRVSKDKAKIDYFNTVIDLNILVRNKLKEIGDGLAWKLVEFDRSIIFMLSNRPDPGFLQVEGMEPELI